MGVMLENGTALRLPKPDCTLATAAATGMPAAQARPLRLAGNFEWKASFKLVLPGPRAKGAF